jgi:hypothetical protein
MRPEERKVIPFAKVDAFDPELTTLMVEAFEMAWDTLCDNGHQSTLAARANSTREIIAKRIIALAKQGVKKQSILASNAVGVVLASNLSATEMARRKNRGLL